MGSNGTGWEEGEARACPVSVAKDGLGKTKVLCREERRFGRQSVIIRESFEQGKKGIESVDSRNMVSCREVVPLVSSIVAWLISITT